MVALPEESGRVPAGPGPDEFMGSMALLHHARAHLDRVTPEQAWKELATGALLVDVRTPAHRAAGGEVPGAW